MKHILMVAAGLLFGAATSASAASLPVWQGEMFITKVTAGCDSISFEPGDFFRAIYAPHLASTSPPEGLAMYFQRSALILIGNAGTLRGKAAFNAMWMGSHGTAGSYTNTSQLTMTPANIVANTPQVDINGTINEFFGVTGCTVSVSGALLLRVD